MRVFQADLVEDLYATVDTSCKEVESAIREYYIQELDRIHSQAKPARPAPRKPDIQPGLVLRPIASAGNAIPILTKAAVCKPAVVGVASAPPAMPLKFPAEPASNIVYTVVDSSPEP